MFKKKYSVKKSKNVDIVIDIRSSSVGAAILNYENEEPVISYTIRKYLFLKKEQDPNSFIENTYKILDEVLEELRKEKVKQERKVKKVTCVFSSPWYEASVESLIFNEEKSKIFTKEYLKDKLSKENDLKKEKEEIENNILSIYLNGYETNNPYNKNFNTAKLSFYKSFISIQTGKNIKKKISNTLKPEKINFNTHPLSILNVLKTNYHSINDFCLFDISGEITEISIFKDGIFEELINIPKGFNYLIRKIAEEKNTDKETTLSKIKLIFENEISDNKLKDNIINVSKEWFKDIKKTREKELESISKNIFITIDSDFKKIIAEIFNNKIFYTEVLEIEKEPIIRVVDSLNTRNLAKYEEGVVRDPLLSILTNFSTIAF